MSTVESSLSRIRHGLQRLREESRHSSLRQWSAYLEGKTACVYAPNTVRRYEQGILQLPMEYVLACCEAAGVDVAELLAEPTLPRF